MTMPAIGDVAVMPAVTAADCSLADNDATVCAALRWAKRTGADVADVGEVCAELGLDLSGALERARSKR